MSARATAGRVALALVTAFVVLASGWADESRAAPACFGAAARDPERPCTNPRLRLSVTPTPDDALLTPNVGCTSQGITDGVDQCMFGAPSGQATETVAMIGDSHASHWRAALAVVARAKRWRVVEMSTPHCPLTTSVPTAGTTVYDWCPGHGALVLAWLRAHPEVRTVFLSNHSRHEIVVPPGRALFEARIDGFLGAWSQLPPSVQRIIVIRDPPIDRISTQDCIRRALARRVPPGSACAVPRHALARDAGVSTAKLLVPRGARVVDLSRFFCTRRQCFPVVGGVLVHRDVDHLSPAFATTLGPYLLRGINRVLAGAAPA